MAKIRRVIRKQETSVLARFDEQLWPVNLALVLLVALVVGIVLAKLRFDDPRWWCNAWLHLLVVTGLVGAGIYGATRLQGKFLRRGTLVSLTVVLALHAVLLLKLMLDFMPELKIFNILTNSPSRYTPVIVGVQPVQPTQIPLIEQPKQIFVNLTKEGKLIIEGRELALPALETMLERAMANNPATQSVVIRADKDAAVQHAVSVVNLLHKLGIENYDFNTAGPEE